MTSPHPPRAAKETPKKPFLLTENAAPARRLRRRQSAVLSEDERARAPAIPVPSSGTCGSSARAPSALPAPRAPPPCLNTALSVGEPRPRSAQRC